MKDVWGTPSVASVHMAVDKTKWESDGVLEFGSIGAPKFFGRVSVTPAGRAQLQAGGPIVVSDGKGSQELGAAYPPEPQHGSCACTYEGTMAVLTPTGQGDVEVRLDSETALEFWAGATVHV